MTSHAGKALVCVIAAATTIAAFPANAGERWRHHRPVYVERHNGGDLLAAGVLGLAAGAVIAGIANQPRPIYREPTYLYPDDYPAPPVYREYVEPAPIYVEPAPVYVEREPVWARATFEPWTPEWYRYCGDRYRSFDPQSGTFMGYDGIRHFCVAN